MKQIKFFFSAGILSGFAAGMALSVFSVVEQRYIHYQLFRLTLLEIGNNLNRSVLTALLVCAGLAVFFFGVRLIVRAVTAIFGRGESIQKAEKVTICATGYILAFCVFAWVINHYLLPGKFHPVSLIVDGALLLIVVFAGWVSAGYVKTIYGKLTNSAVLFKSAAVMVLIGVVINGVAFSWSRLPSGSPPNIILIVVDCLRYNNLGYTGYVKNTTPFLDAVAEKGLFFSNAFSTAPWTKASVASLFTSRYPNEHGMLTFTDALPEGMLTIAEILKNAGYFTCFFNGYNLHIGSDFNFDQGFDFYVSDPSYLNAGSLTGAFLDHMPIVRDKPFFAYIHYMDAHQPYRDNAFTYDFIEEKIDLFDIKCPHNPVSPFGYHYFIRMMTDENRMRELDKQHLQSLYDAEIRYIDSNIEKIKKSLQQNGLDKNTVLIITADHGEEFWDHNNYEHGHTLYNELIHVPLIISGPHVKPLSVERNVSLVDLLPTLMDLVGADSVKHRINGRSLFPLIAEKNTKDDTRNLFATGTLYGPEKYCVIRGKHKLIMNTENSADKNTLIGYHYPPGYEHFLLDTDMAEHNPLQDVDNKTREFLEKQLLSFMSISADTGNKNIVLDKNLKEKLGTIGYIVE